MNMLKMAWLGARVKFRSMGFWLTYVVVFLYFCGFSMYTLNGDFDISMITGLFRMMFLAVVLFTAINHAGIYDHQVRSRQIHGMLTAGQSLNALFWWRFLVGQIWVGTFLIAILATLAWVVLQGGLTWPGSMLLLAGFGVTAVSLGIILCFFSVFIPKYFNSLTLLFIAFLLPAMKNFLSNDSLLYDALMLLPAVYKSFAWFQDAAIGQAGTVGPLLNLLTWVVIAVVGARLLQPHMSLLPEKSSD